MGKEGEKRNPANFIQTTIEGLKSYPRRNMAAFGASLFSALGGVSEFVIAGNNKNAILFVTIASLLTGTSLIDGFAQGRIRQEEGERQREDSG